MTILETVTRPIEELAATWSVAPQWLTAEELRQGAQFRSPVRRQEWMAGRWVLKELLEQLWPTTAKSDWSIQSRDTDGQPLAPLVFLRGVRHHVVASISHANRWVMAALAEPPWRLGCDLSPLDVNPVLSKYWFTDGERELQRQWQSPASTSLIWGLKEAFYKALGDNTPFRPAQWDVAAYLRRYQLELPLLPLTRDTFHVCSNSASLQFARYSMCLSVTVRVAERSIEAALPHDSPFDLLHEITT